MKVRFLQPGFRGVFRSGFFANTNGHKNRWPAGMEGKQSMGYSDNVLSCIKCNVYGQE